MFSVVPQSVSRTGSNGIKQTKQQKNNLTKNPLCNLAHRVPKSLGICHPLFFYLNLKSRGNKERDAWPHVHLAFSRQPCFPSVIGVKGADLSLTQHLSEHVVTVSSDTGHKELLRTEKYFPDLLQRGCS